MQPAQSTKFDLKKLRALHDAGFALHVLRERSKMPLHGGWTKGPRLTWAEFEAQYRKGLNVGVRLGRASKLLGNSYLAVIDLDVKSDNPLHAREATKRLLELFPESKESPTVESGRGNSSAHFYVRLKEPVSGSERKAQSTKTVKVRMPSVAPSKRELTELTDQEIKAGFRLRAAWEISLMSEGRQVVLPGSIHPDTGQLYRWGKELETPAQIPLIRVTGSPLKSSRPDSGTIPETRSFAKVDVNALGLRPDQVEAIETGEGVDDRSAAVFSICMALLKRGVDDSTIVSLLTDRSHFLGQTAYDHAGGTKSRSRAAYWLEKYCLPNAKKKIEESAFDHEVEEVTQKGDTKLVSQASPRLVSRGLDPKSEWQKDLDWKAGNSKQAATLNPTFNNAKLILQNAVSPELLRRNIFALEDTFGCNTPWGAKKGDKRSGTTDDELKVKNWLRVEYGFEASVHMIKEALDFIAGQNEYHPVKDLLESLEWDGVERVENAFRNYIGAEMPEPYLSTVSRKFFMAMIARIYEPGCKYDHVVVFEGDQGVGKSTFGSILVGEKWFMDGLPELSDKDAALNLQGNWLVEMGELSSLKRSDLEAAKAFISRQTDKVRPPYGVRRVDYPRSNVFYGTTNARDYLTDTTGNRRYWCVWVSGCDFQALKRDRLQLLAEAKFLFDFCREPLYLKGKAKKQAERVQESRRVEDDTDHLQAKLKKWLDDDVKDRTGHLDLVKGFQLDETFEGPFYGVQKNMATRKAAADVLRRAGFKRVHTRYGKRWKP